jgi:DNA replication protein DnaC
MEFLDIYKFIAVNKETASKVNEYVNEKYDDSFSGQIKKINLKDRMARGVAANIPFLYLQWFQEDKAVPKQVREFDIETRGPLADQATMEINSDIVLPFIKNIDKALMKGYSLIFYGFNGSGKTYTALLLLYAALQKNKTGYYINSRDLQNLYNRVTFSSEGSEIEKSLLSFIMNCELLVIDEVGKESVTDNFLVMFELLLKHRTANRKSTILISNLNFEAIIKTPTGTSTKNEFFDRYGNSIFNLILERYRVFAFAKTGNFRQRMRETWEI